MPGKRFSKHLYSLRQMKIHGLRWSRNLLKYSEICTKYFLKGKLFKELNLSITYQHVYLNKSIAKIQRDRTLDC